MTYVESLVDRRELFIKTEYCERTGRCKVLWVLLSILTIFFGDTSPVALPATLILPLELVVTNGK